MLPTERYILEYSIRFPKLQKHVCFKHKMYENFKQFYLF